MFYKCVLAIMPSWVCFFLSLFIPSYFSDTSKELYRFVILPFLSLPTKGFVLLFMSQKPSILLLSPTRNISSILLHQVLSEATEDNLIDLGPGSPAVVSNMPNVAPTSLPHTITAPAGRPSSPATLASRLAGLGMPKCSRVLLQIQHIATICNSWRMSS